jgi:hypothetical protein
MPFRHKQLRYRRGSADRRPGPECKISSIALPLPPAEIEDIRHYTRLHRQAESLVHQAFGAPPAVFKTDEIPPVESESAGMILEFIKELSNLHRIMRNLMDERKSLQAELIAAKEEIQRLNNQAQASRYSTDFYQENRRLKSLEHKVALALGVFMDDILDERLPRIAAMERAIETMESKLQEIVSWAESYPVDVFPEMKQADLQKARELLEAGGYTLDRLSASIMRRMITEVAPVAHEGLSALQKERDGVK